MSSTRPGSRSNKYIRALTPVAGENYRALRFEQGKPITVRMRNGKAVTYDP